MKTYQKKPLFVMLVAVGILFGGIFLFKAFQNFMMKRFFASQAEPIITVSADRVTYQNWQPTLSATGSLRAIKGVNVTTELSGLVKNIYFTPGAVVTEGTLLVQLNADAELAQLHALEANARLAKINFIRDTAQYKVRAVSKATVDTDRETLQNALAQVAQQQAILAKKSIRAPFSGRLGISNVDPGKYINVGDPIVTLQSLNPIYVDFYVPQQELSHLRVGQTVRMKVDAFQNEWYNGEITTINPIVNNITRNVTIEATIDNPTLKLLPGMFATVYVNKGEQTSYLTLPQTAVTFNPYGEIVYLIEEKGSDSKGKRMLVKQVFVSTGDTRGDQIAILKGIKAGDLIVTSGQIKLKNGSRIAINNKVVPANDPNPKVSNEKF